jgi:rRNA maturation protein Nop10
MRRTYTYECEECGLEVTYDFGRKEVVPVVLFCPVCGKAAMRRLPPKFKNHFHPSKKKRGTR